uniref:Uncharacterized protein n=1 Tax=Oryza brachyantha TaxID=4533 RepID=J3M9P2_ORYBR
MDNSTHTLIPQLKKMVHVILAKKQSNNHCVMLAAGFLPAAAMMVTGDDANPELVLAICMATSP